MSRISLKIIAAIILSIILVAVSIGGISLARATTLIEEETREKMSHISGHYAYKYSVLLTGIENIINTFSAAASVEFKIDEFTENPDYRKEYLERTDLLLKSISSKNDFIQGIYFAINPELTGQVYESWLINDGSNNFIPQTPEDISAFYSENRDMKWYYDPVISGKGKWSMPYTDATINVKMISYSEAVFQRNRLIGVVGIDIYFEDILAAVEEMKFYETGYGILLDEKYNVIVHPDLKAGTFMGTLENENMDDVIAALNQSDFDVISYIYQGTDKIMGFSKLSNGWVFLAVTPVSEVNIPVTRLKQSIYLLVLIAIILGTATGLQMSHSIISQLNKLHEMIEKINTGDFNMVTGSASRDEIGKLARSFTLMSQKLALSQKKLLAMNREMEFMAFHDPLTHLPNRRYGMNQLSELLRNYEKQTICGIMSIDLDNFKAINDTRGHDSGDRILNHVSDAMIHSIGNNDIMCRLGGDEFLLIFKKVPSYELIETLAERLLHTISEPVSDSSGELSVSCSIGITVINSENRDLQQVLKNADLALYRAKDRGRNNYVFYDESLIEET